MSKKITMNGHSHKSVAEVFEDFVISQTAQGLSSITITNYRHHFHSISNHFDITQPVDALTKSKLEATIFMRTTGSICNSEVIQISLKAVLCSEAGIHEEAFFVVPLFETPVVEQF